MRREFEGRLVKFTAHPKRITKVILTIEAEVTVADYLDLARLYLASGSVTLETFQAELPFKSDGKQMRLDEAVVDDGSTAEVADAEEAEEQGWCCPICHELTAPTDSLPCKECYRKLSAEDKAAYGLGVLCFGCGEYTATVLDDECAWCKSRAVEEYPSDEKIMEYEARELADNAPIDFDDVPGPDRAAGVVT